MLCTRAEYSNTWLNPRKKTSQCGRPSCPSSWLQAGKRSGGNPPTSAILPFSPPQHWVPLAPGGAPACTQQRPALLQPWTPPAQRPHSGNAPQSQPSAPGDLRPALLSPRKRPQSCPALLLPRPSPCSAQVPAPQERCEGPSCSPVLGIAAEAVARHLSAGWAPFPSPSCAPLRTAPRRGHRTGHHLPCAVSLANELLTCVGHVGDIHHVGELAVLAMSAGSW